MAEVPKKVEEFNELDERRDAFQESWKYWKKRQGSSEHHHRKLSSIDPLQPVSQAPYVNSDPDIVNGDTQQQQLSSLPPSREPVLLNGATAVNGHKGDSDVRTWSSYLNVLNFLPPIPLHSVSETLHQEENQRPHAHSVSSQGAGWLSWFQWGTQNQDDELVRDLQSSAEIKKNIREAKRAIENSDSIWAWYHLSGTEAHGETSVLGTKTEMSPVEMKKYPNGDTQAPLTTDKGQVVPLVKDCFRNITLKTKVRTAVQLYYRYPAERHIYLKNNLQKPPINRVVVISAVAQHKGKRNITARELSDCTSLSIKKWLENNELLQEDCSIETISLEAPKTNDATQDNLFKLVINWRESLRNADCLLMVGFKSSFSLVVQLLDMLVSRSLLKEQLKLGLISIYGIIPGPYLEDSESPKLPDASELQTTLSNLIENHNLKVTIVGSTANVAASLALQYRHANIFRTMYFPDTQYNNNFEVDLFEILLMSSNLGQPSFRLLLQLSKYFTQQSTPQTILHQKMFDSLVYNTLSTTRLIEPTCIKTNEIHDSVLNNNYNLVWTLHAFLDNFRKIKHIDSSKRIEKLITDYKSWEPQSKPLKDLKYMFEVLKIDDYNQMVLN